MLRPFGLIAAVILSTHFAIGCAFAQDSKTPEAAVVTTPLNQQILRKEVTVNVPADVAWQAWASREGLNSFFAEDSSVELRPGGPYEVYFSMDVPVGQRGGEGCTVLGYTENEMISFTWNAPPAVKALRDSGAKTTVTITFKPAGWNKTHVSFAQYGFGEGEDWQAYYAYFDKAWSYVFANYKQVMDAQNPNAAAPLKRWVYYVHPTRDGFFEKATPEEEKAVSAHAGYIKGLAEKGVVILAGPSFDPPIYPEGDKVVKFEMSPPGIVVFEAADEAAAKAIVDADPAVQAGVFKARVNPFVLAFQRKQ
jgi:uncharacterized protein YndB with AHSA1/START domain/uncharacterized protein YciI